MKSNLKFFGIAAIAATTLFSSCGKDNDDTTPAAAISTYNSVLLGAQTNSNGSYFSSINGNVYSAANAVGNVGQVDITYAALGANNEPTLLSWDERDNNTGLTAVVPSGARKTRFKASSITAAQFLQIANGDDANFKGINVTTSDPERIGVETNKVYQFITQDNKKGLIHVQTIDPGLSGSITMNVKVQK